MNIKQLSDAKENGQWVKTIYGHGRVNSIGSKYSFIAFGSNDQDAICILREIPNAEIELSLTMGQMLDKRLTEYIKREST